jgi:thioredoxin-like negative regulator of GroEL
LWIRKSLDIDTEEGHSIAQQYGIRTVPSTLIEKKGENPQLFAGIILADDLKSLLN